MTVEQPQEVWCKLFINGVTTDDDAFPIKITCNIRSVHELKKEIKEEVERNIMISIPIPRLYPPDTEWPGQAMAKSLSPDLVLSTLDFLGKTTFERPLIVAAKSRPELSLAPILEEHASRFDAMLQVQQQVQQQVQGLLQGQQEMKQQVQLQVQLQVQGQQEIQQEMQLQVQGQQELQQSFAKLLVRDRATPIQTPSSYGRAEHQRLNQEKKIEEFQPNGSSQAVLTIDESNELCLKGTECAIVEYLTPHLERVFSDDTTVVINSENFRWLKTSSDDDGRYSQKPDLFVCHRAVYQEKKSSKHATAGSTRKFGVLADWRLRPFVYLLCEAKTNINASMQGFGETLNYGAHMSFGNDGPVTVRLMLFDSKVFWLINTTKGYVSSVLKANWTDSGSAGLIQEFALQHPLMKLLDRACEHFHLSIDSNAFLGKGAYGTVFRVQKTADARYLALKIVPDDDEYVQELAVQSDLTIMAKKRCPNVVVGIEENGFQRFNGLGAVLLQSDVGEDYSKLTKEQILESMEELHKHGICHRDARVDNVVSVDGKPRWIDFRSCQMLSNPTLLKAADMKSLEESIGRTGKYD